MMSFNIFVYTERVKVHMLKVKIQYLIHCNNYNDRLKVHSYGKIIMSFDYVAIVWFVFAYLSPINLKCFWL